MVHHLKQGNNEQWQMLSVNPLPPTRGREKEEKVERLKN